MEAEQSAFIDAGLLLFPQDNEIIDRYIHFCSHERILQKTGEAPLARCLST